MAINSIGGFNPYAQSIGTTSPILNPSRTNSSENVRETVPDTARNAGLSSANGHAVADAIKQNVAERMTQVQSARAPEGVDQDLWSVLTKEERMFFVKTGGMGGLTYGRGQQGEGVSAMPIARGGRLDIRV